MLSHCRLPEGAIQWVDYGEAKIIFLSLRVPLQTAGCYAEDGFARIRFRSSHAVARGHLTMAPTRRNRASGPRAVGGGRSPRYEQRRAARESRAKYAPEWSDAAAAAVLEQLEAEKHDMSMSSFSVPTG